MNEAPRIVAPISDQILQPGEVAAWSLDEVFEDPEGGGLAYVLVAPAPSFARIIEAELQLTIPGGAGPQTRRVVVRATDSGSPQASADLAFDVEIVAAGAVTVRPTSTAPTNVIPLAARPAGIWGRGA